MERRLNTMLNFYQNIGSGAAIILQLSVVLLAGFLISRITKKLKLPNVTGYILAGILIGPCCLNLVPPSTIQGMDFVTDIALAFIAFGVGKYFKLSTLKQSGSQICVITLLESLMAALVITLVMIFCFHMPVSFALLLGAIGCATAPASTIMTIRQYKAKGQFVNTILQVVALDDLVALVAFSICATVAQTLVSETVLDLWIFLSPILLNCAALLLGFVFGLIMKWVISWTSSGDSRLVIAVGLILSLAGICSAFDVSPLLACMMLGAVYRNISGDKGLFKKINGFTPPILTTFFVLSGMRLDLSSLAVAGIAGVTYFFVRIVGKYIGAWLGCFVCHYPTEIRRYLGLALIPQAGVSIGLAVLGERILPPDMGTLLSTIILSSAVLYEMVGPVSAKTALHLAHVIDVNSETPSQKAAAPLLRLWDRESQHTAEYQQLHPHAHEEDDRLTTQTLPSIPFPDAEKTDTGETAPCGTPSAANEVQPSSPASSKERIAH